MTKELEALEEIKTKYQNDNGLLRRLDIIETALKNYEELTSKPAILCRRTHQEAQKTIDIICKNYKDVKITNLEDEKKVKACEVIKEKRVDVALFIDTISYDLEGYNQYCCEWAKLTQEEYDLLKEVLL